MATIKKTIKKAQNGVTRQSGTDSQGRPHPIVENIGRKSTTTSNSKVAIKPKSQSQIDTEKKYYASVDKESKERDAYNKMNKKTGEVRAQRDPMQPTLASMGFLNKTKSTKKPDKVLEALAKKKNGGSLSAIKKVPAKRVGPVDPKGAFTKVQKKTLAGAKGKASLTKDKQLGATKMAKCGTKMSKK